MKNFFTLKFLSVVSAIGMLFASSTVNSACSLVIYEEKAPEKAMKLVK